MGEERKHSGRYRLVTKLREHTILLIQIIDVHNDSIPMSITHLH